MTLTKKAPVGFRVTLTDQQNPLAAVPINSGWTYCWKVVVKDAQGNEYGLVVPPGPAFMADPDPQVKETTAVHDSCVSPLRAIQA